MSDITLTAPKDRNKSLLSATADDSSLAAPPSLAGGRVLDAAVDTSAAGRGGGGGDWMWALSLLRVCRPLLTDGLVVEAGTTLLVERRCLNRPPVPHSLLPPSLCWSWFSSAGVSLELDITGVVLGVGWALVLSLLLGTIPKLVIRCDWMNTTKRSHLLRVLAFLVFVWEDWIGADTVRTWRLASIKWLPTPGARLKSSIDVNPPSDWKIRHRQIIYVMQVTLYKTTLTFLVSTIASALLRPTPTKVESSSTVATLMSTNFWEMWFSLADSPMPLPLLLHPLDDGM